MNDIHFIDLEEAHLESCWRIVEELDQHYDHPIGGNWTREKLHDEICNHYGLGICDSEGELHAFCLYRQFPERREIMLLATRPRHHRMGAMRALIRSFIDASPADEPIWLEVHAGNLPAIGLYESLGFELCGERPCYYSDGAKALLYQYKRLR